MPDITETIPDKKLTLNQGPVVAALTREDVVEMVNTMGVTLARAQDDILPAMEKLGKAGGANFNGGFAEKNILSGAPTEAPEMQIRDSAVRESIIGISSKVDDTSILKKAAQAAAPALGVVSLAVGVKNLVGKAPIEGHEPTSNKISPNREMIERITADKEVVANSAQKAIDAHKPFGQFTTREGRKELLGKLGVDVNTADDFRLVMYQDKAQTVIFKGKAGENGITLTDSMVIQDTGSSPDGLIKDGLFKGEFKPLPKSIELPAAGEKGKIELAPEQLKKLSADVTLMALADQAMSGKIALAGSNASLPYNKDRANALTV